MGARQRAHLLHRRPTRPTPTRRPAARSGSPSTSGMPRRRSRACGRWTSTGKKTDRLTADAAYSVGDFQISDDGKWIGFQGGSAKRYERNITRRACTATSICSTPATGSIERLTNNREVGEGGLTLLARQPLGRLHGARRHDQVHHDERPRLYLRAVDATRQAVPQAGRQLRRRRLGRLLVEGRQHDLLQRRLEGDEPAASRSTSRRHRPPDHQREGVAVGQSGRGQRRAADHLRRRRRRRRRSSRCRRSSRSPRARPGSR